MGVGVEYENLSSNKSVIKPVDLSIYLHVHTYLLGFIITMPNALH